MENSSVLDLYCFFEKDNIVLLYSGRFNDYVLVNSTDLIKNYVDDELTFEKYKNKMIFLMIESFQNIIRYAEINETNKTELLNKLFITRKTDNEIYVTTSNIIENYQKDKIIEKIKKVNEKDNVELKELFLEVLTNRQFSEKGGAGLGFIEMSRKTKAKLDYGFDKINSELSHFYFLTKMKPFDTKSENKEMTIDDCRNIHKKVSDSDVLLLLKNDFSEQTTTSALMMIEENLKTFEKKYQKIAFHIIVEVLQNVSKHSARINKKRHAMLIITKDKRGLKVSTGNLIEKKEVGKFKSMLTELKSMSKNELSLKYITKLVDEESEIIGGIGFIDIAREAKDFDFDFIDFNENYSFFVFSIIIEI
ncbi:MAG: SiaB family protein kinase [Bacteroidales bacterium]|nr:SiaB family protein kinase [Bacteroidales bacterium]